MGTPSSISATIGALCALCLWSLGPVLTLWVDRLPVLELLSINFTLCGFFTVLWISWHRRWAVLRQPLSSWLVGLLAISGTQLLYINAFRYAPPIQVELINYLWPLLTLIGSGLLLGYPLHASHLIAAALGFLGLLILIGDVSAVTTSKSTIAGYVFALGSACCWTTYTLLSKKLGKIPAEMLGLGCLISAPITWLAHKMVETTLTPLSHEWVTLAIMGIGTSWIAYYLWDSGIKEGHFRLLNVSCYFVPVASVYWLAYFGLAVLTSELLVACLLVAGGSLLCAWADTRVMVETR